MWHLVKGPCEIHNDHICLSVTPVLSSFQVTKPITKTRNGIRNGTEVIYNVGIALLERK